jgi:cytochrome c oxidase subunit II
VRVELESADVIHSFWVPQLHGKLEMVPGRTNVMYIEADEPGVYFGKCAEFCGQQHANMEFLYIVEAPTAFEAWLEAQAEDAAEPVDELAERGPRGVRRVALRACATPSAGCRPRRPRQDPISPTSRAAARSRRGRW